MVKIFVIHKYKFANQNLFRHYWFGICAILSRKSTLIANYISFLPTYEALSRVLRCTGWESSLTLDEIFARFAES